jgi:hypothetical protein
MKASLILIGVALLFIGAIFVAVGGSTLIEELRYRQPGARAEATAIGKTLHRATETSDTAYEISYRFRLPDGSSQVRLEPVPVHLWERIDAGSPLTVEYLQDDPSSARVVRDRENLKPAALWFLLGSAMVLGGLTALKRSFRRAVVETPSPEPPPQIAVAQEPSFWPLARRSPGFWFGAMFLSVGGTFFLAGGRELYRDLMFQREARVTQAVVLTKEIRRSGRQNRTKHYEATYRYTVAGAAFEARDVLSFDGWSRLIEREPAEVFYHAADPGISHLSRRRPWGAPTFMTSIGTLFSGIGATFVLGAIRRARLEWRLRQGGVSTSATVVDLREQNLKIDGVQQWRLNYRYQDLRGGTHDDTITIPEDEAAQWNIGDAGKVLYDPAQPAAAVWVGRE